VTVGATIGLTGWVLPHVAVIDTLGLNDWVVARTPVELAEDRRVRSRRMIGSMFRGFDRNDDGVVTSDEVERSVLANPALQHIAPRARELGYLTVATLDANGDGRLDRDEILDPKRVIEGRVMAHDRHAPDGYVEGFQPNVDLNGGGHFNVRQRARPLTDAEICAHETRFRQVMQPAR
jgi:hypothetical protein